MSYPNNWHVIIGMEWSGCERGYVVMVCRYKWGYDHVVSGCFFRTINWIPLGSFDICPGCSRFGWRAPRSNPWSFYNDFQGFCYRFPNHWCVFLGWQLPLHSPVPTWTCFKRAPLVLCTSLHTLFSVPRSVLLIGWPKFINLRLVGWTGIEACPFFRVEFCICCTQVLFWTIAWVSFMYWQSNQFFSSFDRSLSSTSNCPPLSFDFRLLRYRVMFWWSRIVTLGWWWWVMLRV